jgi:uncharacterized protein (DUF302 family)
MEPQLVVATAGGLILGLVAAVAAGSVFARHLLIVEEPSPLGFEETVAGIVAEAEKRGWRVSIVHQLDISAAKEAGQLLLPASVVELCRPEYAAEVLRDDGSRMVTSLMPCRLAVYMTSDGDVTVSRANTGLLRRLFGGVVSRVLRRASRDAEEILTSALSRA